MKIKRDFKVKVRALRTEALCKQCKHDKYCKNNALCSGCELYNKTAYRCACTAVEEKQPCPYYVRANKQEA